MVERPAGREDDRELRVGRLDRRLELDREEPPAAARERRRRRVEVRRARMRRGRCTAIASRAPRSAGSGSRTSSGRGRRARSRRPRATRTSGHDAPSASASAQRDPPVLARLARAVERLAHAVHAPLGVRERPVLLREARRRQDDVRVVPRRVVQEDVLRDDELARRQALLDVARVRLGVRRVLADQVERLRPAVVEPRDDLVEPVAGRLRHLDAPRRRELRADLRVVDRLVPRQVRRVRAGVVQPLDVVLAAERVQPGRLVAEVAGHQDEVRERPDVVDAARVLGHPERVEDPGVLLACVLARGLADRLGVDAGDLRRLLGRVARDDLAHLVEARRCARGCTPRSGAPPRGSCASSR